MKKSKILSPVDQWKRRVYMKVWHLVMWGGVIIMLLLAAAIGFDVPETIIVAFVFTGVWAFLSDPITNMLVYGTFKQSDTDGVRR